MSTNGWGKGSVNNTNGWGAGAINNDIGWGDSQLKSWSGDTDIDGGTGIPVNTVAPVISGTTTLGSVLTTTNGTWTAKPTATFTYQWKRNGSNIIGATNSTYTLVNDDGATNITCEVTATNDFGSANATSNTLAIPAFTDADAQAFITAAAITNPTQQSAINQLVTDLKGYGVWTKMKALYPFVGGTASSHSYNLKNTAQFQITWNGGVTHSSTGVTGNGTNGYGNTGLLPSTQLSLNNTHISYYTRTNNNGSSWAEAGVLNSNQGIFIIPKFDGSATGAYRAVNSSQVGPSTSPTDVRGLYIASRISSGSMKLYRNSSTLFTDNQASGALFSLGNVFLLASNVSGSANYFSARQTAFASIGDGLTDTEAANFYTAVQTFQVTLGRSIGTQTVSDADAQAFVTNAGIVDQVEADAVNNLVIGLKADGLWSKMKAVYPFVGGTASSHKFNLKDPRDLDAAFRLVFNGGWTHSSNGAKPNGTNAYADTKLNFNTTMLLNDAALSFYSREDIFTAVLMGCGWDNITSMISPNYASGVGEYSTINGGGNGTGVSNKSGLFTISRLTSTNVIGYRNGTQYFNRAVNSTNKPNYNVYIGARNYVGATQYSSNQCAFSAIHDGLTPTEAANFYTAVQAFNTTLNRNV